MPTTRTDRHVNETDEPQTPTVDHVTFHEALAETARVLRAMELISDQSVMGRYNEAAQTWLGIAAVLDERDSRNGG